MADGEHDETVQPLRHRERERPGDGGAEVVTDDVRLLDPQLVEDRDDVTDALADAVGVDVVRPVGFAEPAQVRAR